MATAKVGLLKQAWHEIPEVVGSTFMALIGVGLGVAGLSVYNSKNGDDRKHKFDYIVVRSDDPRAQSVHVVHSSSSSSSS